MIDKGLLQKCQLTSHAGEGVNRHDLGEYIHNDNDHHRNWYRKHHRIIIIIRRFTKGKGHMNTKVLKIEMHIRHHKQDRV